MSSIPLHARFSTGHIVEQIVGQVRCAVVMADARDSGLSIVYANPAVEQVTGYPVSEIVGRGLFEGPWLAADSADRARLARLVSTRKGTERFVRGQRKGGVEQLRRLWLFPAFAPDSAPTHYFAVLSPCAQDAMVSSNPEVREARLDALFALSPDGLVISDHEGRIQVVNAAFARILDQSVVDLVGRSVLDVEADLRRKSPGNSDWPDLHQMFEQSIPWLKSSGSGELTNSLGERRRFRRQTLTLAGDEARVFERSASELNALEPGQIVFYYRDVTRSHEATRLKDQFLSTAAHELRTPLSTIVGFSELLKGGVDSPNEVVEYASLIYEQSMEMARLLDELLDLARIQARGSRSFEFSPTKASAFVREFVKTMVRDPRFARVRLKVACAASLKIEIDRDKLGQALRNILSNAVKYSPPDSEVLVTLDVEGGPKSNCVRLSVQDRGIGISRADLAKVFDPFFRAANASFQAGTGLGLSLVREIIRRHRGTISIDSEIGRGTTVHVRLPLSPSPATCKERRP